MIYVKRPELICITAGRLSSGNLALQTEAEMKFRDILAIETLGSATSAASDLACQLAAQNGGAVSGALVGWMPTVIMAEGWIASPVWEDLRKSTEVELDRNLTLLRRRLDAQDLPIRRVHRELLEDRQGMSRMSNLARHHDVCVVGSPQTDAERRLVESVLFHSGRPVLVAPLRWSPNPVGRIVVVAWKPTREASRALAEAEAFVSAASRTFVLRVDADGDQQDCCDAGEAAVAHLRRRGANAESRVIAPVGETDGRAILTHAEAVRADLIVMGAYGRSRASEFVFGGVTRELLSTTTIPILMAH